ncbi:SIR2-like domain [Fragilaria crotonensis]|nr:SIR2-like domain [Fragilaria crotonensis]
MAEKRLQDAMATALSLDYWTAPDNSQCAYPLQRLSINFLCMDQVADEHEKEKGISISRAARFQEIFLDLTGWYASRRSTRFFLDDRFHSNLDEHGTTFKDGILDLLASNKPSYENESAAYNAFLRLLQEDFGLGDLVDALAMRGKRNFGIRKVRSMSSLSTKSERKALVPDCYATEILQEVINCIENDADTKRAAAMTNISGNFERIKDFLDRFGILARLRPKYRDPQMDIIVERARTDVVAEFSRLFELPSHVFVCNSSVCNLACDVFLCPVASIASTTLSGTIWEQWQSQTKARNPELWRELTGELDRIDFHRDGRYRRVAVLPRWPPEYKDKKPKNRRERHLLALPVIGTGGGGAKYMTGEIIENLLHVLNKFVSTHKVDCVLVAADEATYAHAQTARQEAPSSILNLEKINAAQDLAELAASGQLSLFLGAGTSIPSGLPNWEGLLKAISDQLASSGTTGVHRIVQECNGDLLTMADKLEDLARSDANGNCLKTRVANYIKNQKCHPSLVLALLLSLPSKSIVTTNYDELIETAYRNKNVASSDKSSDLSILPHHPEPRAKQWLLKMHGCVSHPKNIVLSGKDYAESKVLTGIVQANLLTTHLLFCGFSLTDPNYLKVVKEVRGAMHSDSESVPSTTS